MVYLMMLFACKNDLKMIHSLSYSDSVPAEIGYDIELIYSDSGQIVAFMESPLMMRHGAEDEVLEFPDGFKVIFYDSLHMPESEITAKYGIMYENEKRMEARNNVVVKNTVKNEVLETEHLVWDRKSGIIYSDVFIKITKPDQVLFGDGLRSNQNFDFYEIKNPTGELSIFPDEQ